MKNKDDFIHMKKKIFQGKSDKKADKGLLRIQRGNQLQTCTRKFLNVGNVKFAKATELPKENVPDSSGQEKFLHIRFFLSRIKLMYPTTGVSLVAQMVKNLPAMRETWVLSLGWEDPLEEGVATHSSILAWRIPWAEEPGGLQSTGSQRVRHD